jgi:translation initiation factor IF-3
MNGRIRAREVRVIGPEGNPLGILSLHEAISRARAQGMDLVEVAANAQPPVCRIVDYGKFRYEQAKKQKESRKAQQHVGKVKEVQLRPSIDPHDFQFKLERAIEFLCDDMKVKVTLRFRGREMAHPEVGMKVMERFIKALAPFGTSPQPPRRAGRSVNAIVNPLPRNKRAPRPHSEEELPPPPDPSALVMEAETSESPASPAPETAPPTETEGFANRPFEGLDNTTN